MLLSALNFSLYDSNELIIRFKNNLWLFWDEVQHVCETENKTQTKRAVERGNSGKIALRDSRAAPSGGAPKNREKQVLFVES